MVTSRNMNEERGWEDIDTDCLVNIFSRLGLEDLTLSVPFVCRSWYQASLDPTCWRVLKFQGLDFMPWSNLSKEFSNRYGLTGHFSFSGFLKFCVGRSCGEAIDIELPLLFGSSNDLTYISQQCPKLRKAAFLNLQSEEGRLLPEIIGRWRELEQLEMPCKPPSFQELVNNLSPRISKLKMSTGSFNKDDISAIVSKLPKLKCLYLSNSYMQKDGLLAILTGCKFLQELIVRDCVGFEVDDEVSKRVAYAGIKVFEYEGSRLTDESGYETDECDPLYVRAI